MSISGTWHTTAPNSSGRCTIGRAGDYFTSVSVGALFGRLLARQFAEMWERLGHPTLLEAPMTG